MSTHEGTMLEAVKSVGITFKPAARRQESLLTPLEKKALIKMAHRLPRWVHSDHLTLLGFMGMAVAGACYFYSRSHPPALVGVVVGLVLNWFGDSLDGTLARVRNCQRPRYGFYVDHVIDAFGALFLISGLGLSGYMSSTIALIVIIAYFLLSIELYLATYAIGVFRLSFGLLGPTELRIVVAFGTLYLLKQPVVHIGSGQYLLCDVAGIVTVVSLGVFTMYSVIQNTIRLYREERLS
jgi:phosphatidylglycerophosphate synthase